MGKYRVATKIVLGRVKRWPIIRHIRWAWHSYRFCRWWERVGSHYWLVVNDNDLKFLNKIWRGEA